MENINFSMNHCQIVFPRLNSDLFFDSDDYKKEIINYVEMGVGGFCLFNGSVDSTSKLINQLQKIAEVPLLFAADFENGLPMRLSDGTSFPHSMALGKISEEYTFKISRAIAAEAKNIGVNWILAPVCDINSNKDNPVINIRSFGENLEIVNKHLVSYIKGMQEHKVISCAKHFPGHGDSSIDSHIELPSINKSFEELNELELLPFMDAIQNGVKSIMVGHLSLPKIDNSNLPSSLSEKILKGILRGYLGYQGLVVSDALDMKAIKDNFNTEKTCELALNASVNILLMPPNPMEAIEYINKSKSITLKNQINSSVNKILELKSWCGVINKKSTSYTPDKKFFFSNEKLALKAGLLSTEVIDDKKLIPIKEDSIISGFAVVDDDIENPSLFFKMLAQAIDNDCDFGFIDENITKNEIESLKKDIIYSDLIIICFFNKPKSYKGNLDYNEKFLELIDWLCIGKNRINVIFGNPYLKEKIIGDSLVLTYSDSLPSLASAIIKLSGRNESAMVK